MKDNYGRPLNPLLAIVLWVFRLLPYVLLLVVLHLVVSFFRN